MILKNLKNYIKKIKIKIYPSKIKKKRKEIMNKIKIIIII